MNIENLVSTMNRTSVDSLITDMRIKTRAIVINQVTNSEIKLENYNTDLFKLESYYEKGLSKSRNRAIKASTSDFCIISDDDLYYENDYLKTIDEAYKKYPNADIIAFVVDNEDPSQRKKIFKEGKVNFLKSMKLSSVQLTFRRKRLVESNIEFDERFGAGSDNYWGEENIFLFDCIRKKLKIVYVPIKIATLRISESTWNKEICKENSIIRGKIFYRMSKKFYWVLILQFAIRKRKLRDGKMSFWEDAKYMFRGARLFKKDGA